MSEGLEGMLAIMEQAEDAVIQLEYSISVAKEVVKGQSSIAPNSKIMTPGRPIEPNIPSIPLPSFSGDILLARVLGKVLSNYSLIKYGSRRQAGVLARNAKRRSL
uniref:Reverse transcriptase domain-containing protein n=1 Tax=Syphacia muris TaxID=451379 RepID=A0A0N5AW50_9BILA